MPKKLLQKFPLTLSDVKKNIPKFSSSRSSVLSNIKTAETTSHDKAPTHKTNHATFASYNAAVKPKIVEGSTQKKINTLSTDNISLSIRQRMVERLAKAGVQDSKILEAFASIPRHYFLDPAFASQAYEEVALPIGEGQTISKPLVIARMLTLLCDSGEKINKALEIGTGCAYQAAIMSKIFAEVYSIERIKWLHERAKANLRLLRLPNIRLHYGDGLLGFPQSAPFDGIVLAAAGPTIPEDLCLQLSVGGRLIAPVGNDQQQVLVLIKRISPQTWEETQFDSVRFVPIKTGII